MVIHNKMNRQNDECLFHADLIFAIMTFIIRYNRKRKKYNILIKAAGKDGFTT